MCYEAGIPVTAVPGAAACITGLILSGLPTRRFAFEAFLPTDKKEREAVLDSLRQEQRTIVLYEAPHRLVKTLKLLARTLGEEPAGEHLPGTDQEARDRIPVHTGTGGFLL